MTQVKIRRLDHAKDMDLPAYETANSAGMDLCAALEASHPLTLKAGERALIPTGLSIALPSQYEAQIRPRSGLALKHGISLVNSPGTIDADYRGEIKIIIINHSHEDFIIERGMRIAQMVVAPVEQITWLECESLDETERGAGGFGSTGIKSA